MHIASRFAKEGFIIYNSLPECRLGVARGLGLCRKCLRTGHHLHECITANCRNCGKTHRSLLYLLESPSSSVQLDGVVPTSVTPECVHPKAFTLSTANAFDSLGHKGNIIFLCYRAHSCSDSCWYLYWKTLILA